MKMKVWLIGLGFFAQYMMAGQSCTPLLSELPSATFNNATYVASVAWQTIGSSYYVAMGGAISTSPQLRVLQFDQASGVLSTLAGATFANGTYVFAVDWQLIGSSYYVAMGGGLQVSGPEVRILTFDPVGKTLSALASATVNYDDDVATVAWQAIGSSYYVAIGGVELPSGPEVQILQFNPGTGVLSSLMSATFDYGADVTSVAWQAIGSSYYVAMAGRNLVGGPEVRILQFNPATGVLSALANATFDNGSVDATSVAWQAIGSSYYVAMGSNNVVGGPEVRILQFNPISGTLNALAGATLNTGADVFSVAWQVINSSYYVAIGGIPSGAIEVRIAQFDPVLGVLSELSSATYNDGTYAYSVDWQSINSSYYVAIGGNPSVSNAAVRILNFTYCASVSPIPSGEIIPPASPFARALVQKYRNRLIGA